MTKNNCTLQGCTNPNCMLPGCTNPHCASAVTLQHCFCCCQLPPQKGPTMNADRLHFTVSAYPGSCASLRSLLTLYRLHACLPSNMLLDLTGLPQDYFQCSARHLWCWVPAQEPDCVLLCFAIGSHKQGGTKSAATRTVHGILKLVRQTI